MRTEIIISELRRIMIDNHRCFGCGHEHSCSTRGCAIMRNAADQLESQQARIAELESELKEERYRHDRVQDFEVAESLELTKYRTAEKEGRLFILPCKVGDTVYVNGEMRTVECIIFEAYLDGKHGIVFNVTFECDSDCEGCPFSSWHQDIYGEYSCDGEYCTSLIKGSDFGKTIFLSRKDAETALSKPEPPEEGA